VGVLAAPRVFAHLNGMPTTPRNRCPNSRFRTVSLGRFPALDGTTHFML
jgi:hypothetical protein